MAINEIYNIFPKRLQEIFYKLRVNNEKLEEIRIRCSKPIMIKYDSKMFYLNENGELVTDSKNAFIGDTGLINEILSYASNYSMYAHEEDLKNGFITIKGGHRIGLAGRIVMEKDKIKTMKNISYINIRVSHQIKGCANKIMPYITKGKGKGIYHTLIISPPGCGKTTLLRDLIRQISNGGENNTGISVGVVDERSEIGACYMGKAQNDLGICTDVLDCCPKSVGMLMLVRSMSPQVIAVDEIGSTEDVKALEYIIKSGCSILATVHGSSVDDVLSKPVLGKIIRERIFERYIILNNERCVGNVEGIFDERGTSLYKVC